MKYSPIRLPLFIFLLFFSLTACNQQASIAVLDYKNIINNSTAVEYAGNYLNKLQNTFKEQLDSIKNPQEKQKFLEEQQALFAQKIQILDAYLNETLEKIIDDFRVENKLQLIISKDTVLSFAQSDDRTEAILKKFNAVPFDDAQIEKILNERMKSISNDPTEGQAQPTDTATTGETPANTDPATPKQNTK